MSLYRRLCRKPKLFLSVTGMNLHQFQTLLPQFTHADDKFERRRKRKSDYSGKKKRHTRKQIIISTPSGIIVDQSPSVGGRPHDFKVFKDDHAARALCAESKDYRVTIYGDSGFDGMSALGLPVEV